MTEAPTELLDVLIGRTIAGKYVIDSFLGGGAMGSVFRARQIALDKIVAIKVMRSEFASDPSFVGRFRREARAASKLSHAHSIGVSDFGEEPDGLLYIVMEFVAGRDLEVIMQQDGVPLANERIADILSQVLSAVAVAHDHGIVHRDLKPANILIVPDSDDEGRSIERVKVCDFGIASMRGAEPDPAPAPTSDSTPRPYARLDSGNRKLTAVGALLGTPEYMSPEQATGQTLGAASDLYSIGAILYELLTGQTVYTAASPELMVLRQATGTPIHPRVVLPSCGEELAKICMRALSREPEDRHPSARAMRAEIRATLGTAKATGAYAAFSEPAIAARSADGGLSRDSHQSLSAPPFSAVSPSMLVDSRMVGYPTSASMGPPDGTLTLPPGLRSTAPPPATRSFARWGFVGALCLVGLAGAGYLATRPRTIDIPRVDEPPLAQTAATNGAAIPSGGPIPVEFELSNPVNPARAAKNGGPAVVNAARQVRAPAANGVAAIAPADRREPAAVETVSPAVATSTPASGPDPQKAPALASPTVSVAPTVKEETKPFSASGARVMASVASVARASRVTVAAAVNRVSFDGCYRDALVSLGRAEGGAGTAHLEIDEDGIITSAQVRLPGALSPAASCFAGKLRGQRVNVPDTGAAAADISFTLVPN